MRPSFRDTLMHYNKRIQEQQHLETKPFEEGDDEELESLYNRIDEEIEQMALRPFAKDIEVQNVLFLKRRNEN